MQTKNKKILITSALPYANGSIHIGHLVEYIQTDIYARFLKLIGRDVIYCCADDTHGTPIEIKASQMKIKPEELIEQVHKEHTEDFKSFQIHFDSYYSTNSQENKEFADKIFLKLKEKGLIYQKEVENFYDEKEKRFLPDRYVKGECPKCNAKDQYGDVCEKCNATYKPIDLINPFSTVSGEAPIRKRSMHYFFKLSELSDKLEKYLLGNKNLQPEIVNYVKNWIKEGLQDWDISRDGPYFGFNIPGEEDKYYYVWLDAPIGYIASTANYCKQNNMDAEKDYWKSEDSEIIHFIGKDITYFHFLFWPAMLMEAGFNLPEALYVHGFLTVNGEKMSKSRGTFLTAKDFLNDYKPDYLRYYYAKSLSKKMSDIDLNLQDFKDSCNNELVGNIVNYTYRVLNFINKNLDSKLTTMEDEYIFDFDNLKNKYYDLNYKEVVKEINNFVGAGNKYFQEKEPWKLIKEDKEKAQRILTTAFNFVKDISIILQPILPEFAKELQQQINLKDLNWNSLTEKIENHEINTASIIIKKIEKEFKTEEEKPVFPLNLKVAKILEIKPHPDADKLYVMQIDLGTEKRQLVAGLRPYYAEDELVGKQIVVVSNLKPANLRGQRSEGMLLAAGSKDKSTVKVLQAPKSKPGNQVSIEGFENNPDKITFEQFQKLKIKTKDKKATYQGKPLHTKKEEIVANVEDGYRIS